MKTRKYDNYPFQIVALSNLNSIAIYGAGAFIVYRLGTIWLILYLLYIAFLETRLLLGHCTSCYYYGKVCAFGKGKLSSLLPYCFFLQRRETVLSEVRSPANTAGNWTWAVLRPSYLVKNNEHFNRLLYIARILSESVMYKLLTS